MPECLTYAFHKRMYAPPCGRCTACLAVAPIEPPYTAPPPSVSEPADEHLPVEPVAEIVSAGGGWYDVVVDGEPMDRVRGKEAAEARAAELEASED
jgi:hypothetical protein